MSEKTLIARDEYFSAQMLYEAEAEYQRETEDLNPELLTQLAISAIKAHGNFLACLVCQ